MSDSAAWRAAAPFYDTLRLRLVHSGEGSAEVALPLAEAVANRKGNVHGGATASAIDMAMSEAIRSSISDIRGLATISLTVHYLSVGASDLVASATMTRCGGSTAFASAEVRDRDEKLVATGQGAFRIIR